MMMTETKPGKGGPPPPAEPWEDWKPVWDGKNKTPHDVQESHSPTAAVATGLTEGRRLQTSQRRIVDLRLWEAMSAPQQDAALEIAGAYEMMSRGMGFSTSNMERIPSGSRGQTNMGALYSRFVRDYVTWSKLCHQEKVSHSMIIDVLVFGMSLRQSDHDRRVKKGTSRRNLLAGLSIYCKMMGRI